MNNFDISGGTDFLMDSYYNDVFGLNHQPVSFMNVQEPHFGLYVLHASQRLSLGTETGVLVL